MQFMIYLRHLCQRVEKKKKSKRLQNLEVLGKLYGNGSPFFVGNQLTWTDLLFHKMAGNMLQLGVS